MTPREVQHVIAGWVWRKDQLGQMLSVMFASVANRLGKPRLLPKHLYRPVTGQLQARQRALDARRKFDEIVARMGPEAVPVRRQVKRDGV
jgi:hypothetical protein